MNVDRLVLASAGLTILGSLALSQLQTKSWLWFTAFVAVNMLQSAFTGFCPFAITLRRLGVQSGRAFR